MERKDSRGRILRRGEYQRGNGSYEYRYSDQQTGSTRSVCAIEYVAETAPEGKAVGSFFDSLAEFYS